MTVRPVLVVCTLTAVLASVNAAGEPGWESNLATALAKARQTGKPVLVDVYADWCGPCQKLAASFRDPRVSGLLQKGFVAVKVDADADAATTRKYKVSGLPTLLVLSPDGKELARVSGNRSPAELMAWLGQHSGHAKPKPPAPARDDISQQLDAIHAELTAKLANR